MSQPHPACCAGATRGEVVLESLSMIVEILLRVLAAVKRDWPRSTRGLREFNIEEWLGLAAVQSY